MQINKLINWDLKINSSFWLRNWSLCLKISSFWFVNWKLNKYWSFKKKFSKRQTASFCSQLSLLLSAGLSLLPALEIIRQAAKEKNRSELLGTSIDKIAEGFSISQAVEGMLPAIAVGSISAAEQAGRLEESLSLLAKNYDLQADLQEKIVGAMVYPAFILVLSLLTLLAIFIFVLPGMKGIMTDLGVKLPLITQLLLNSGDWFMPVIFTTLTGLGFMVILAKRKLAPEQFEKLCFRLPFIGKILLQGLIIDNLNRLGMLLQSGVPLVEALELLAAASTSQLFKKIIITAKQEIENGASLSESLSAWSVIPEEVVQMIRVGESSGDLAAMLNSIAGYQEKAREGDLKRVTTMIEPVMTLSVGLVVGLIVLAVFMPLLNLASAIN